MNITTHITDGIPSADLFGRFDAYEVPKFIAWLDSTVKATAPFAVINLASVDFIDSSGLSALVKGLKRCREYGGDLVLCQLQHTVRTIFELTRLDSAFKIHPDEQSALQSIEQSMAQ
jgi:anti-sigma B factor antagonist